MQTFYRRLLESGVFPDTHPELAKRLKLSNQLVMLILFLVVPYSFIFCSVGYTVMGPVLLPVGACFITVLLLNRSGRTTLSRTLLIIGINLVLVTYALVFGRAAGIHLLFFVFVGIPFLIFSLHEVGNILLGVILSTLFFYLVQFGPPSPFEHEIEGASQVIYFCMISLILVWTVLNYIYFSVASQQKEALLEQKEKKFRDLIENAPDAMVLCTREGTIQLVNNRFKEFFGYETGEVTGKKFSILVGDEQPFSSDHRWIAFCDATVRSSSTHFAEQILMSKDGSVFAAELAVRGLDTDAGMMISTSIRDIAERRQLEDLRIKSVAAEARNRELEQFAYIVSHDLKSPVQNIQQLVELLKVTTDSKEEREQIMGMISGSVTRMGSLIRDLLKFSTSGAEAGEHTTVDCTVLVEEIRQDLSSILSESRAQLHVSELPMVHGHPTALRLLFQNLIHNAVKFRKRGVDPLVAIASVKESDHWKFSVRDNGIGIAAKDADRLFRAFQRLHDGQTYDGHGLGLAHCAKIVSNHHGTIWVESEEGQGSTFLFTLPKAAEEM